MGLVRAGWSARRTRGIGLVRRRPGSPGRSGEPRSGGEPGRLAPARPVCSPEEARIAPEEAPHRAAMPVTGLLAQEGRLDRTTLVDRRASGRGSAPGTGSGSVALRPIDVLVLPRRGW